MYNMLMQINPAFGLLCAIVGITKDNVQDMGRVRDAWISEDAKTIGILHRNYGEDGLSANDTATSLPTFREHRKTSDYSYNEWLFDVPEIAEDVARQIAEQTDNVSCWERYVKAIEDMGAGKKTPQTEHMLKVGEKILGGIVKSMDDGESRSVDTQDGSVDIISPGKGPLCRDSETNQ
jgi:hypothetical protein